MLKLPVASVVVQQSLN